MNWITISGIIIIAIGTFVTYYGTSLSSGKDKNEIIDNVKDVKTQLTRNEKILVTPPTIIVPAKAGRDVPVVVTNNYPYPVFMVILEIEVIEGDLDLTKPNDFQFFPMYSGTHFSKDLTIQIPQMNSGVSENFIAKIDANKYDKPIKLKLSVNKYLKEPSPNFYMDGMKELPKTMKVPDGFNPEFHNNDTSK